MNIHSNIFQENKTFNYLYPCLKFYGEDEFRQINSKIILSIGIKDMLVENPPNTICILYKLNMLLSYQETRYYLSEFENYLHWIRKQEFYVKDYLYSYLENQSHMVVLKIPEAHNIAYNNFLIGKYSKMYNNYHIAQYFKKIEQPITDNQVFINKRIEKNRNVLIKNSEAKESFVYTINEIYGTTMTIKEFGNGELDFPLNIYEEVFNYNIMLENNRETIHNREIN